MNTRLLSFLCLAALLTACDQKSANRADSQPPVEETRLAELRELEQRAAQREADANAAELALERKRLAGVEAGLELERQKLAAEKASIQQDAEKMERWRADEQRLKQRQAALRTEQERSEQAQRETRERARDSAREAQQVSATRHLDYFYKPLDAHGDWMEIAPYGPCWQPRVAQNRDWRPYTDGMWVFTDYGWTWKANEPFGWATYHYGRWAQIRRVGWVWVPGSEWAPAWVAWRRSDRYVGWAPLPPEAHSGTGFNAAVDSYYDIGPASYTFVPTTSFGEPTYRGIVVEPERNVTIVNQTVNVTKVQYRTVENRTVVFNAGPELTEINAASKRPVQRMRLERVAEQPDEASGRTIVGNVMKLLAPAITSASKPNVPPPRVKEVVRAAEVERGWSGADAPAVRAVRAQIQQEAGKAEQQARVAAPAESVQAEPVPADSHAAAREAEAARLASEKKMEADRANAKQAEQEKKAMADREAAAQQQEDVKRAAEARQKAEKNAEKNAAEMKAKTDAEAAKAAARAASEKSAAERPTAEPAEAEKKPMPARETATPPPAEAKPNATPLPDAERSTPEMKPPAAPPSAPSVPSEKEAIPPKPIPAPPSATPATAPPAATPPPKAAAPAPTPKAPAPEPLPKVPAPAPAPKAPAPVAPPSPTAPAETEKKPIGDGKKGVDRKGKAEPAPAEKAGDEAKPNAAQEGKSKDAKEDAKSEKKRAEDEAVSKGDPKN